MFFFVNPRSEEIFYCVSLHRCFPQIGGGGKLLGSQETRGVLKTFLENVLRDSSDPEILPNENKKGSVWKLRKKNNILTPKAPTPNIRNQATKKHVKLQCWWHLFDLFSNSLNLWKLSHHGRGLPTQSTRDARR